MAKRILNWRPTVSLEDGLTRTIAYFAEMLSDAKQIASHGASRLG
jgi:dTDP-D-glucose 4,6-dehydratase